ncbi:MAG: GNAT family N-acetyltransferase [Alphaproteobacteria bacterium]
MKKSGVPSPTSTTPQSRPNSFLLDTNVIIPLEDDIEVEASLARLNQLCSENGVKLLVHESSNDDINRDKDEVRKKKSLSKLKKYASLASVPLDDTKRKELFGVIKNDNDRVDTDLLYAIQTGSADYLVSEDTGVHSRVKGGHLQNRVLYTEEALELLTKHFEPKLVFYPHVETSDCKKEGLHSNLTFFDSLKVDYEIDKFNIWLDKCIAGKRKCFIIRGDEDDTTKGPKGLIIIDPQPKSIQEHRDEQTKHGVMGDKVLKLCLFRLEDKHKGEKFGEHLLKVAMDFGFKNDFDTMYLTVFPKHAPLIHLIEKFGFIHVSMKGAEKVYVKTIKPPSGTTHAGFDFHKHYWPYIDARGVKHFLIPIVPNYHNRLFPELIDKLEGGTQLDLSLQLDQSFVKPTATPGNAIRKVYICNSQRGNLPKGSILWFYRTQDSVITTIGIAENYQTTSLFEELRKMVGGRSVYQSEELEIRIKDDSKARVVDFFYSFHLEKVINLKEMRKQGITYSQSIAEIPKVSVDKLLSMLTENDRKYLYV